MLIIDDEAAIRESLETLLEMEGYDVQSAATADEGLTRIGDRPYDLVLLDLALPDRNGIDLLAELHVHDPQLAVIMITAYGTVENAVKAMQAGAANFVQKPWDNENCWPTFAPPWPATGPKKRTFSSSAPSSSATTLKTSWARASPC